MSESKRDILIVGLRNAYGMEGQAVDTLEKFHNDLDSYPELKAVVAQHLGESKRQKGTVEQMLGRLGEEPSTLKEAAMRLVGNVQGVVHAMAGDEVLKNTMTLFAYEHFEQASYRSLIAMAEELGESGIAQSCRLILAEEEATAEKVGALIEPVTRAYLQKQANA